MKHLRYIFTLIGLIVLSACSEAIPTVTDLTPNNSASPPSNVDDTSPSVNSGGGLMQGGSYKIFGKMGPSAAVMSGTNYKINMTGDN